MLSDYIDSCENIRKAMRNTGSTSVSETVVCTKRDNNTTCASVIRYITLTPTKGKNSRVTKTNGYIIKRCRSAKFTFCTRNTDNTTCISLGATICETTVVECILQEFCEKVTTNTTCKVLKEIKKECKCECNNICMDSDDKCKKFIKVTMEHCKKEATSLILQLNENLSPELLNTIILRFIGLQLYLRVIQEFCLLRDYFTAIIKNLTTCCDVINSCTCGSAGRCCSTKGKCLCTIFYKLVKATKILHDRYCRIIGYMNGACDEDLYKVIPSLSLTRSIYLLTKYFNEYIAKIDEESECKTQAAGTANNGPCPCHKYSSKLDDVMTLLLGGIEDIDDCDGLLSDVISMMSPLVKAKDYKYATMNNNPSQDKKDTIDDQLKTVNDQKDKLNGVIGINSTTNCDGTTAGGETASSSATCTVCSDTPTQTPAATQAATNTTCNGDGTIAKACSAYTNNGGSTGCAAQSGSTPCTCPCPACHSREPGECCCFCKDVHNNTYDGQIKTCLGNLVKKLKAEGINCNGDNGKDCLMCYLCVLKHSINKLKDACNGTNGNGGNLNQTLKDLPENISDVVDNICGKKTLQCCNNSANGNGCRDNGTCTCKGDCCKVNDRFCNFTKFLLGTCATETKNNNCKTITKTLMELNETLKAFLENGGSPQNGCTCCTSGSSNNCTINCCCGTDCTKDNGCTENKPIKILSCVVECGLKGIHKRSEKIVDHIGKIEECLKCINKQMCDLDTKYDGLHNCISGLGQYVKGETDCLRNKIENLKEAKKNNQEKFNNVITTSKSVLSDICGLYRVYSIESYSYSLSPYYHPTFPIINNSSFHLQITEFIYISY